MEEDAAATPSDVPASVSRAAARPRESSAARWRRWHRISGAGFLGVFLVVHLLTNASVLAGAGAYGRVVVALEQSHVFPLLELLVLVPLAIHVGYGVVLLFRRPAPDAVVARYGDRRLWTLQRIAAALLLAFLVVHLVELRVQRLAFGLAPGSFHTVLSAHLSWTWAGVPWVALVYLLGLAATTLHFSNGLFAATSAWRSTVDAGGERRVRIATLVLGAALFLTGAATIIGFATGTRLLPIPDEDTAPCGSDAVPAQKGSSR